MSSRQYHWIRLLILFLSLRAQDALATDLQCGNYIFSVQVDKGTHRLDNTYDLRTSPASRLTDAQSIKIFNQAWFYASCQATKAGQKVLLIQSFCGGSACIEERYSILDAVNLQWLLPPNESNTPNIEIASDILGFRAPYLPDSKSTFCCASPP